MVDDSEAWQNYVESLPPELAALHREPPEDVLPLPDGRSVTVSEILAVLREQVAGLRCAAKRTLREDRHGPGLVAAAWRHTTFRQAQAVLALFDAGLAAEAQTNARACIEHSVTLQRLALAADQGEVDSLLAEMAYQQQRREARHLDYLDGIDARAGGQHRGLLDAARSEHEARKLPTDKSRPKADTVLTHFRAVPAGLDLYSVYGRLSENTHAGLHSAVPYLVGALKGGGPVPSEPEPVPWAEALAVVCWSCWAADDAMRRFLNDGDDLAARHAAIMAKIGLATG
jgi:hypothetical protein